MTMAANEFDRLNPPPRVRFAELAREMQEGASARDPAEVMAKARLQAHRARLEVLDPAVTPDDLRRLRDDTVEPSKPVQAVRWFLDGGDKKKPHRFLVLAGTYGLGKTVAAVWGLLEQARRDEARGLAPLVGSAGGYVLRAQAMRQLATSFDAKDQEQLNKYMRARFLILDELGGEDMDEKTKERMDEFVNDRQRANALTIMTANLSLAALTERYGKRWLERIRHQGAVIHVTGESLRRR